MAVRRLILSLLFLCAGFGASAAGQDLAITGGNNQSANINVQFGESLVVNVTNSGSPASGVTVTFTVTAGAGGAGGTLINSGGTSSTTSVTAKTNSSGNASVVAAANSTAGPWTVTASASGGSSSPSFSLTNVQPTVIASNLPGNDGLALGLFQDQAYAVGFTMTSTATFSSATIRMRAGDGVNGEVDTVSSVVVGLYQDNGSGKPGTLIQSLSGPSLFSPGAPIQDYAYAASPQVTLSSGQTYWLQLEYTGTISFQWESDSSNNLDGITPTGEITYVNTLFANPLSNGFNTATQGSGVLHPSFELDGPAAPTSLSISATHASPIFQGGPGVISLAVTTSGATTAIATVSDTIDSNFTINSAPGCSIGGQVVTCTMAAGSTSTTFTIYVTVSTTAPTPISNTATLTDSGDDVTTGSSTDSIAISPQAPQVDSDFVQILLSGSLDGGGTCAVGGTLTATDELQNTSSSSTVTNPYAEIDQLTGGNTLLSQSASSTSVGPGDYVTFTFHIQLASCDTFDLFFNVYGSD
jgi:hypothetical protein